VRCLQGHHAPATNWRAAVHKCSGEAADHGRGSRRAQQAGRCSAPNARPRVLRLRARPGQPIVESSSSRPDYGAHPDAFRCPAEGPGMPRFGTFRRWAGDWLPGALQGAPEGRRNLPHSTLPSYVTGRRLTIRSRGRNGPTRPPTIDLLTVLLPTIELSEGGSSRCRAGRIRRPSCEAAPLRPSRRSCSSAGFNNDWPTAQVAR
jgi:hypothetical protein